MRDRHKSTVNGMPYKLKEVNIRHQQDQSKLTTYVYSEQDPSYFISACNDGVIYKAYPVINEVTDYSKPAALKVSVVMSQPRLNELVDEVNYFQRYYSPSGFACRIAPPRQAEVFQLMEYLPGESLARSKQVDQLLFANKISILAQIALWLNLFHHYTPTTGPAVVHRDIKKENFIIDINQKAINVYPVDMGSMVSLQDDAEKIHVNGESSLINRTPEQFSLACENDINITATTGYVGTKSDIYAFAPIVMSLLGAVDPAADFKSELNLTKETIDTNHKIGFNQRGFLNLEIPEFVVPIAVLIRDFTRRMAENDYSLRANTDETLAFFVTLDNTCKLLSSSESNDIERKNQYAAKLILLSKGLWTKAHASYDFEINHASNAAIVSLYGQNLLTKDMVSKLLSAKSDDEVKYITILAIKGDQITLEDKLAPLASANKDNFLATLDFVLPTLSKVEILTLFDRLKDRNGPYKCVHEYQNSTINRFRLFVKSNANNEEKFLHTKTYQVAMKRLKQAYISARPDFTFDQIEKHKELIDYVRGNGVMHFLPTATRRMCK